VTFPRQHKRRHNDCSPRRNSNQMHDI
jgi:hypothetical protein